MFKLDSKLQADTFFITDLKLSSLLLMNNANYPWLILVPRQENVSELTDLSFEDQIEVLKEINLVCQILQNFFKPYKLNIANLGNVVRQLHIHLIARFENDLSFPKPVWGSDSKFYEKSEAEKLINQIQSYLKNE
ncbi:MAG: HIT domain-containing protein [Pelagibacterales bacterium]|nr:HIT domain-containing protein [Pelagibacterales bacterium]